MTDARFHKNAKVVIRTARGFEFARFVEPASRGYGFRVDRVRDGLPMLVDSLIDPTDLPTRAVVDGVSLATLGY
jgi:hypothetical protein